MREAIGSLAETNSLRGDIAASIQKALDDGQTFSAALCPYPMIFSAEEVALITAGEETGRLDAILDRIAVLREEVRKAQSAFLTQIAYPLLIFHFAALTMPIGLVSIMTGRLNYGLATSITLFLICGFWAAVIFCFVSARRPEGRAAILKFAERVPGLGAAIKHRRYALFATTLEAAYESGVKLDRGVALAAEASGAKGGALATRLISEGKPLRDALPQTRVLPPHLLNRVATAEQAGDLSSELRRIATEEFAASHTAMERTVGIITKGVYALLALAILFYALTILGSISRI